MAVVRKLILKAIFLQIRCKYAGKLPDIWRPDTFAAILQNDLLIKKTFS